MQQFDSASLLAQTTSKPLRKSFAFPQCLAFAKLSTRKKEAHTSKLASPLFTPVQLGLNALTYFR